MVYVRPSSVPLDTVWARFEGRAKGVDGKSRRYLIKDVPRSMFPRVVDHLSEYFAKDEPLCKAVGMFYDPEIIGDIRSMWFKSLEDRLSIVCIPEDEEGKEEPTIVAVNVLAHSTKDHKIDVRSGSVFERVISAVMHITNEVDVHEMYKVEEYLGAFGLAVAREFRGQNIGAHMLNARIPLCKALGFKLTATVFTAVESQILARKCGFKEIGEVSYKYLAQIYNFPGDEITTESMIYMVLEIS